MADSYRTVSGRGVAEVEVSGSRFRAVVEQVESEFDARAAIRAAREEFWDATHHCSAFVIGPDRALAHSADDGEPTGTAGARILQTLTGAGLTDVVAVVTRWFGGTMLGTGGLGRAYAEATRDAIKQAGVVERVAYELYSVSVSHAQVGQLEHDLRARGAAVLGVEYADQAELRLAVPPIARQATEEIVAELTGGEALLRRLGDHWVDL